MAFSDDFNRSNQTLETSANWMHDGLISGALGIVSNQLRCTTSDGAGSAYKAPDQGSADHYVQFTIQNMVAGSGPFIACRLADRNNFVGIRNGGGFLIVYRRVAGSLTHLWEDTVVAAGNTVRFECQGTNWTVKVNGVTVQTGAIGDASLTSTRTGLVGRAVVTDPWIDDFETGPISAPAHKSGTGTINASAAVSISGRKRSRGSSTISAGAGLTGTGHKRAHGSASLSVAAATTGLGRKRAFGRAVMAHLITMTGGAAVEVHPDIQFDGAQPGEIALSGVMPGEIILTGRA